MYGKNYFWKPHDGSLNTEKHAMGQLSPTMTTAGHGAATSGGDRDASFFAIKPTTA